MSYHSQYSAAISPLTPVRSKARVRVMSDSSPRLLQKAKLPECGSAGTTWVSVEPSKRKRQSPSQRRAMASRPYCSTVRASLSGQELKSSLGAASPSGKRG